MSERPENIEARTGGVHAAKEGGEGHHTFAFTYDDTGADAAVLAPNGWIVRQVVDKAYVELGETPRANDRVEFDGQLLTPYYQMKVKEFVDRSIAPALRFNIVSNPGGARE
jgi:hypothetical protein